MASILCDQCDDALDNCNFYCEPCHDQAIELAKEKAYDEGYEQGKADTEAEGEETD